MRTVALSILIAFASRAANVYDLPDETSMTRTNPFSKEFIAEYVAAKPGGDSRSIRTDQLEAMLAKYRQPQEQAELHRTLADIFSTQTGMIDRRKAIGHFDQLLTFSLPPTMAVRAYLLKGNMHEQLQENDDALKDYLRGLLLCVQFDLPEKSPVLPAVEIFDVSGSDEFVRPFKEKHQRQMALREKAMFESKMVQFRYFLVDAAKRVATPEQARQTIALLSKDTEKVQKAIRLVESLNERPWK